MRIDGTQSTQTNSARPRRVHTEMAIPYSHLYNAVILPVAAAAATGGQRFQISASRNDRETPRYISPAWTMEELRRAFSSTPVTEAEFQELLRGNRRGTGGRDARRLLFTEQQLQEMTLTPDLPPRSSKPEDQPTAADHAVLPAGS